MLNKIMLIGRVAADPDMTYTPRGMAVTRFTLLVARNPKKPEEVDEFPIVAFNKLAESCFETASKGSLLYVEGSLRQRKRSDQVGTSLEVTLRDMMLLFQAPAVREELDLDFLNEDEDSSVFP